MRILWFTNSSVDYQEHESGYNGGGWMTALKKVIDKDKNIELGISFLQEDSVFKKKINTTTYYPISIHSNIINKIVSKLKNRNNFRKLCEDVDEQYVQKYLNVINDFNPSVIHIWGTEKNFGLVCKHIKVPVIIHLQGIINPCLNAFFPPNISLKEYVFKDGFNPLLITRNKKDYKAWIYIAEREKDIFKHCEYYMGRTEWDRILSLIYAPNSTYFHCDEALRDEFYTNQKWQPRNYDKFKIVTTISSPLYKGGDLLLKTAYLLKYELNLDFEWYVFGVDNLKFQEKLVGIRGIDVNIALQGVATSKQIQFNLLNSSVFVHPSYIDNSPNSICEAQISGVPVIACNVGGISSLIEDNATGVLVPANDPYSLAYRIKELCLSKLKAEEISIKAIEVATKRHNLDEIFKKLISIYKILHAG